MAALSVHDELSLISKGLNIIVSDVIGPECIVKLRRQLWDVRDLLKNCDMSDPRTTITSGSMSEGFIFRSSDIDYMYLDRNTLVCTSSNCLYVQNLQPSSLFRMANEQCSPGFALLECVTCDRNNKTVFTALFRKDQSIYLSSKVIRESFLSTGVSKTHGPCQSAYGLGIVSDRAYTLKCPVWPEQSISFVIRSVAKGWPSYDVLKDICNDGCLFVPINSKQQTSSDLINLEWRMSFSLAEKKLIYSMNHCQFLCYGLTKLFLNEVVKKYPCIKSIKDLLCSYFMKTAVFWEIHECSRNWTVDAFLFKFWNVFRRLIKWVSDGYCPNFFIPENNMFFGKICSENQRRLLSVLRDLYFDGYWCLLRCPSLNVTLQKIITQPDITERWSFNEEEYVPISAIETTKVWIVKQFDRHVYSNIITVLNNTLNINTESEVMLSTVKLSINCLIQQYAQSLLMSVKPTYRYCTMNRNNYLTSKAALGILLRSNTFLCMEYLYYAKYTYMTGYYHKTIDILHFIKQRIQSKLYMYRWNLDKDIIMYTRQQGMPYDILINSYIVQYVEMKIDTLIEELQLESRAQAEHIGTDVLRIPPLVLINFLLLLSHARLGDYHRAFDVLEELQILVHNDDGYHIHHIEKPISLEILGICFQICGNREAAFQTYINALNENFNYFKQATEIRIRSLFN